MTVISNFSEISLFLNELSSNLTYDARIKIAQNLIFFVTCHKRENLDSDFGHFVAKHLFKFRLPLEQLRSLVTKKYT